MSIDTFSKLCVLFPHLFWNQDQNLWECSQLKLEVCRTTPNCTVSVLEHWEETFEGDFGNSFAFNFVQVQKKQRLRTIILLFHGFKRCCLATVQQFLNLFFHHFESEWLHVKGRVIVLVVKSKGQKVRVSIYISPFEPQSRRASFKITMSIYELFMGRSCHFELHSSFHFRSL